MRKVILALFWFCSSLTVAFSQTASNTDAPAAYVGADVVFTGRVEKIQPSPQGFSASFQVDQPIKGITGKQCVLNAGLPSLSRCHALEKNHSYLVYGQVIAGKLWIDPCNGSKLISAAEDDLKYIHTVNPRVSQKCTSQRLQSLTLNNPIVVTAQLVGTESTMGSAYELFRPWCGLTLTSENAYYHVTSVLKGDVPDADIVVEHPICWDTITVDGYQAELSSKLFQPGNVLLLFLGPPFQNGQKQVASPYKAIYGDQDEDCGAIDANDEVAQATINSLRADPEKYTRQNTGFREQLGRPYTKWLNETVDWLVSDNAGLSCSLSTYQ
jgi:hypothetical protein